MKLKQLHEQIDRLDAHSLRALADEVRGRQDTAADEVSWWRATIELERTLRTRHVLVQAAMASHQAAAAVLARADELGIELPDADVTAVARAAAEAARAVVGEDEGYLLVDLVGPFLAA